MIIDFHSHYIPVSELESADTPVKVGHAGSDASLHLAGRELVSARREAFDFDALVRDTESSGLDLRVLAVPPFCFQYEIANKDGQSWSSSLNDSLARAIERSPKALRGFATVPLQDPAVAAQELERCTNELSFVGVQIASNINGVELDNPSLDPFWDAASALGTPVLIHPHYVAGIDRMSDYHLRNLVGNPMETSLAAARLIFGGVLERYPNLTIILSHGGGALPYLIGRLQHGYQVRDECRQNTESSPISQMRRFYFDSIVFEPSTLRFLIDQVGASRVVVGTDYPFDMSEGAAAVGTR